MWNELFGKASKRTTARVLEKLLLGNKYKDAFTRFRLALIILVEAILCPMCAHTNIRPEVIEKVEDIDAFLKYPWGRESFLLTVNSTKNRSVYQLAQDSTDSTAIQGFAHAMVLVTVSCCPTIIVKPGIKAPLVEKNMHVEEIVDLVVERSLTVNVVSATTIDKIGQVRENM